MLNHANRRDTIFHKEADYEAFEPILAEALKRVQLKLFSSCILSNHWHLVLRPEIDGEMSRFWSMARTHPYPALQCALRHDRSKSFLSVLFDKNAGQFPFRLILRRYESLRSG